MSKFIAEVEVIGISPLTMNADSEVVADAEFKRQDKNTQEVEAKQKIWRDNKGNIAVSAEKVLKCLTEAGTWIEKKIEKRKRALTNTKSTVIPDYITVIGDYFFLNDGHGKPLSENDCKVDMRRSKCKVNKTTFNRVHSRPKYQSWGFSFSFSFDEENLNKEEIKFLLIKAGNATGFGGRRPAFRGQFGRFRIAKLKFQKTK